MILAIKIRTIYATGNVTVAGLHEERERKKTAAGVPVCYWSATGSNDDIRHVFIDAMTDCSTAPLPLRKCSACHSQYSLITNPEMELKQINFMAFKRTFIQSEVEQLYIRNKTTRTT
jgi:hypothetical protein